jgi:hypothetical protein
MDHLKCIDRLSVIPQLGDTGASDHNCRDEGSWTAELRLSALSKHPKDIGALERGP